ncbi:hypothetical protein AMECASPLE_022850 [Ameca splendens]|uniref:Uncharacterized protein n=1 Tax=Ameca splendens TaxID=208324 RepID=A0ABV1A050_9TELE
MFIYLLPTIFILYVYINLFSSSLTVPLSFCLFITSFIHFCLFPSFFLFSIMYVFNYQTQSYRSRGIISPLTAKPGQNLLFGGDWTLAVCQGQGMKHQCHFVYFYFRHMYQE